MSFFFKFTIALFIAEITTLDVVVGVNLLLDVIYLLELKVESNNFAKSKFWVKSGTVFAFFIEADKYALYSIQLKSDTVKTEGGV